MIKQLISKFFREIADKIDNGTCEISEGEAMELLSLIAHEPISKSQAYQELGISRAKFDQLVKDGKLPKGQKRLGFKELVWYRDELIGKQDL